MRIHSFSAVIAISSILAACGEKDANSTANTEESSPDGITTYSPVDLWTPAAIGDTRTLKARIDQGADINALLPEGGMTALAIAADFGQNDAVKMLLKAGADPDARNENQSTPSLGAAFFGRPDCLKTLLDAGADPNLADENGTTTFTALAIPWELTKGIADLMQMPLDQGTLEIGREKCWQILGPMTDIWTAAATGEITAIKARIAEGIDVNAQDPVGATTPLAIAASFGQIEAVRLLLEDGANPNATDQNGATPALGAAFFGRPDCLKALLDAGADASMADKDGTTAFTALLAPWSITKTIADAMMMPLDRNALDQGREKCVQILESR